MEDLLQKFPDLTQSMVRDVFRSVEGDSDQAQHILKTFTNSEPTEDEIQRKLRELANFQILGQDVVMEVLKESRWDVEKAIIPLFAKLEEYKKEERRKKYEEERQKRAAEVRQYANTFLKELFAAVPEAQIQKILDDNDGDVDATTDQLVEFLTKEDERQKKEKEEEKQRMEKQQKRDALAIRFSKTEEQVDIILENLNWDIQAAIRQLLKMEQDQKYQRFAKLYNFRRPEEIRHALEINDYDEPKTMKYIDDKIEQEKQELQRRQKEDTEKKEAEQRRIQELRAEIERKREEEARKLQTLKEEHKREASNKSAEERKLEEKRIEVECKREEDKEEQRKKEEDEQRERQIRLEENKIDPTKALMDRSVLIRVAIDNEVANQLKVEDHLAVIKKGVIDKIRAGSPDGPGLNGQVPLTKEMQEHINKLKSDNPVEQQALPNRPNEAPVQDSTLQPQNPNNLLVQLIAKPSHVEYGGTITLEWEHSAEPTVNDWIGMYTEGAQSKEYVMYEWISTRKGSITAKAPSVSGNYYFKYFVNKSYVSWGTSNIVKVGPLFKLTPTIVDNSEVKIKVEQIQGQPCPNAWVAMYEPEQINKNYYSYLYLGTNSELTFKVPKVGIWEFRLFPQKAYCPAESCKVNLNGTDKIQLSIVNNQAVISYKVVTVDPYYDNVWIGIFNQTETDNRQWRRYKYVYLSEGEHFVKAMQTPGTYEARLFARSSNTVICRSNTVTILPNKI